jgi:drug/metabolite transporter (DMT)-like permease
MNWIFFAIIGIFGIAISNILERALLRDKKSDAFAYSFLFQMFCAILIGFFAVIRGFVIPPLNDFWPNLLMMTIFYAAGTYLLFKAFQAAPASEVTIAFSTRVIWTITAAFIFLGEEFSAAKATGTILIFLGVVLVSADKKIKGFDKGTMYALGAAFFWGTAFANDAYILRYSDTISYAALAFLLPALPFIIVRPKMLFELKPLLHKKAALKIVCLCIVYSVATLADYYALAVGGNASQVSPTLQTSIILTVLLAAAILGEKNSLPKKLFAALLAAIGVVLLS